MTTNAFIPSETTPWQHVGDGVRRQILGHGPECTAQREGRLVVGVHGQDRLPGHAGTLRCEAQGSHTRR